MCVAQLIRILAGGLLFTLPVLAQVPAEEFQRLTEISTRPAEELGMLQKGVPVVRTLPPRNKQEVATLGLLRIKDLPEVSLQTFRRSFDGNGAGEMKTSGKFSQPPVIQDLHDLELDKSAVKQLRICEVGKCDLNLSADFIKRLRREVDWTTDAAGQHATDLFRNMLVEHVRGYASSGNSSLGSYDNRFRKFDLSAAHGSLLSGVTIFDALAPEFTAYLDQYPHGRLDNVDSRFRWSVIDIASKQTITVSHMAAYTQLTSGTAQHYIAWKQIYSSRFLDASVTMTALLRVSSGNQVDTYVVFLDRSRSDVLEGPLGRFARGAVEQESVERVKRLLDRIGGRLSASGRPGVSNSDPEEHEKSLLVTLISKVGLQGILVIGMVVLMLGILVVSVYRRVMTVGPDQWVRRPREPV